MQVISLCGSERWSGIVANLEVPTGSGRVGQ
jgi:hypothetical protein